MSNKSIQTFWRGALIVGVVTLALFAVATGSVAQGEIQPVNSGFDPTAHGFSFENYVNDANTKNLTPEEVKRLFGDKACASQEGGQCILSPVAKQWMEEINQAMAGGHCEGMAVLSALFYTGKLKSSDFGTEQVKDLKLAGNEKLQREIAFWWATQATQPTRGAVIKATPKEIVAQLVEAFKPGAKADVTYSIGIYKRDGTGGHAVTPYALEDKGNGVFAILVYDNNYPGLSRVIEVDINANTWKYEASTNPSVQADLYEGDAQTKSLDLTPSSARMSAQVCTFCEGGSTAYRLGGMAAPATQYNEIYIVGGGVRVLITDDKGRRLGRVDGRLVNEIPGADAQFYKGSVEPWARDVEPVYHVPVGIKFTVTLDGTNLKQETAAEIAMIGPGYSVDVQDIKLAPGQKDTFDVSPDGTKLSYKPGKSESPDIVLADEGQDNVDWEFYVKGFELEEGGSINVMLDTKKGQLQLNTVGNKKAGTYQLVVTRYDDKGMQEFGGELKLEPADTVYLDYLKWQGNGKPLTVEIDYKSDGSIDESADLEDLQK
jgi:hypothetical protein